MRWGAAHAARSMRLPRGDFDLVHIQTPFVAHYAGVRSARRAGMPCGRDLSHLLRGVPASLRAGAAAAPRPLPGARLHPLAVRRSAGADRALRADARGTARVRRDHADPRAADRACRGSLPRRRWRALPRRAPGSRPSGRWSPTSAGWRTRRTSASWCRCSATCCKSVPQALLVIAGEGPARECAARSRWRAWVSAPTCTSPATSIATRALLDCYAAADVFVFASRTETQGLVLLEAMAQGAPVVSTAELGTRSILMPGCGALVVPEQRADVRRGSGAGAAASRICAQELGARGRATRAPGRQPRMARRLAELYGALHVARRASAYRGLTGHCTGQRPAPPATRAWRVARLRR